MQVDIIDPAHADVYFNQLGGYAAVGATVDAFLVRVGGDARINGRFAETDMVDLRAKLVDQVCQATGGYCVYTGADMLTAHAGMCVSNLEFDYMAEDFLGALTDVGVPYSPLFSGTQLGDALVNVLLGMRTDIVEPCEAG
jgi:hemoglobin